MIQESSIFSPYHSKNFSIKDNNHTSGPPPNIIKNIYANTYPNTKPCIVICFIASEKFPVSFPNVRSRILQSTTTKNPKRNRTSQIIAKLEIRSFLT